MALQFWMKATLLLCCYGFFKSMKPSEPFLTPYLKEPPKNFTEEQLDNQIYPVWTYSYLVVLVIVFLFTDILRYKPVIIVEGLAYLSTRVLLIWSTGVLAMQFMMFTFGVATGAEVAYYSYIYAVVSRDHYQKVTSYTQAAVLTGRMMSGVVGQLLISFNAMDYLGLNYISLASVSLACVFAFTLPKASGDVFGIGRSNAHPISEEDEPLQSSPGCIYSCQEKYLTWKQSLVDLWHDFKVCYSQRQLLIWSLWWAFATCGEFQVETYTQILWDVIFPSKHHKIYNGGVTAVSQLVATGVALALAFVRVNWTLFGELCLAVVSIADAFFLYISTHTTNIWLAYLMYVLFRIAYTFLITIARWGAVMYCMLVYQKFFNFLEFDWSITCLIMPVASGSCPHPPAKKSPLKNTRNQNTYLIIWKVLGTETYDYLCKIITRIR